MFRLSSRTVIMLDNRNNVIGHQVFQRGCPRAETIRLGIVQLGERQHIRDGVLYLDAQGLEVLIVSIHADMRRPTGKAIEARLCRLIRGQANFRATIRATLRAGWGINHAPGSAQLYLNAARDRLAEPTELDIAVTMAEMRHAVH